MSASSAPETEGQLNIKNIIERAIMSQTARKVKMHPLKGQ